MPAYFPYWLKTCGCNKDINFIIYTDLCLSRMSVPDNVRVVQSSFEEFKLDLQAVMPFPVEIGTPYKLCDCKPLFGAALEDDSYNAWKWPSVAREKMMVSRVEFLQMSLSSISRRKI